MKIGVGYVGRFQFLHNVHFIAFNEVFHINALSKLGAPLEVDGAPVGEEMKRLFFYISIKSDDDRFAVDGGRSGLIAARGGDN